MFKCKLCEEKDFRINDLKAQISDLRKLVYPSQDKNVSTPEDIELQKVLNVSDETFSREELEKLNNEADMILMGSYGNSQVDII